MSRDHGRIPDGLRSTLSMTSSSSVLNRPCPMAPELPRVNVKCRLLLISSLGEQGQNPARESKEVLVL